MIGKNHKESKTHEKMLFGLYHFIIVREGYD